MRFVVILAILVAQGNCDCSPKECSKRFRGACNPFDGRCYVLCKEGDESCRSMNRTLCTRSVLDKIPGHPEYADHFACGVALPRHWCDCNTVDLSLAEQDVHQRLFSEGLDKMKEKASDLKDKVGDLDFGKFMKKALVDNGLIERALRFAWEKTVGGCGEVITIGIMFMPKDMKTLFLEGGYTKSSMEAYLKKCLKPEYKDEDGGPDKSEVFKVLMKSAAKAPLVNTDQLIRNDPACREKNDFEKFMASVNGTTVGSCVVSLTQEEIEDLSEEIDITDVMTLIFKLFDIGMSCPVNPAAPFYNAVTMAIPGDWQETAKMSGPSLSGFKEFALECVADNYWKDPDQKTKPDKSKVIRTWMISLIPGADVLPGVPNSIFKDEPQCRDKKVFEKHMEMKGDDTCNGEGEGEDSSEEEEEEEEEKSNSKGNGGAAEPQATTAGVTRVDGAQIAVAMILLGVELL